MFKVLCKLANLNNNLNKPEARILAEIKRFVPVWLGKPF